MSDAYLGGLAGRVGRGEGLAGEPAGRVGRGEGLAGGSAGLSGGSAGRILVVEDDPEAALYAVHVLGRRGRFDVTHTADPAAALRMAAAERWDLVVTDLDMPGMSGLELVNALRRVDPALPVAVLTAHICADETVVALRRCADEFLTKPVGIDQLIETASALVGKGRAARAR
jgi:DNA-binding response OmpR family regulator